MKCENCEKDGKMNTCLTVNVFSTTGTDGYTAQAVTKFYCVDCVDKKGISGLVKDFVANVEERHKVTPPNVTVLPVGDEDPEQMKKEIDDWVQSSGGGLSSSYLSPV